MGFARFSKKHPSNKSRVNRELARFQIGVDNRDYHHLSQSATIPGLVVIRGFINTYPGRNVAARLPNVVSDYATTRPTDRESGNTTALIVHDLTQILDGIPLGVGAMQATLEQKRDKAPGAAHILLVRLAQGNWLSANQSFTGLS